MFPRIIAGGVIAGLLASRGWRKRSLTPSGAIAAFVVGWISFGADFRFGAMLLAFYFTSSFATKLCSATKQKMDQEYEESSRRSDEQVLSNSAAATIAALAYFALAVRSGEVDGWFIDYQKDWWRSFFAVAVLGNFACSNGDTWASELGVFSIREPVMITRFWRRVPRGTNGGVSFLGTILSILGGVVIGIAYCMTDILTTWQYHTWHQVDFQELVTIGGVYLHVILLAAAIAFVGSLIDSLLGATLQATYYNVATGQIVNQPGNKVVNLGGDDWLSNSNVNLIATTVSSILAGYAGSFLF